MPGKHGQRLAVRQGTTDKFLHGDILGSTRYLSDATGNGATQRLLYDAYGGRVYGTGIDAAFEGEYAFAGGTGYQSEYETSAEPGLGLQYLQQRYYDPAAGRFISADPIGYAGG